MLNENFERFERFEHPHSTAYQPWEKILWKQMRSTPAAAAAAAAAAQRSLRCSAFQLLRRR
jgi:hypothetical protein